MSKETKQQRMQGLSSVSLAQRIEELRGRAALYVSHGDTLMLQGMAAASLREQCLTQDRITLED
ncbi:hypothetical protein [Ruegeria sp. 6PALISEP08]|uniref:hypothetical protein n=1 Tax=Ruegeria sp. 6PALISEP08 TaxID=1225660 RepID=UPI00067EE20E|nr:hypothetical protein [Ruegeria sp. 6PALISEP08]